MTANYTFAPGRQLPESPEFTKVMERQLGPGAYALFAVVSRASSIDNRFVPIVGSNPLEVGYIECQLRNAAGGVLGVTAIDNVYLGLNVRTTQGIVVNGGIAVPSNSSGAVSLWCRSVNAPAGFAGAQLTVMRIAGFE